VNLHFWPESPFSLPFIENLSGLAWDISSDGMRRLSEVDETGDNIFGNAHVFYRDALFRRSVRRIGISSNIFRRYPFRAQLGLTLPHHRSTPFLIFLISKILHKSPKHMTPRSIILLREDPRKPINKQNKPLFNDPNASGRKDYRAEARDPSSR